jgi:glucose/arabinose dehydrogenase
MSRLAPGRLSCVLAGVALLALPRPARADLHAVAVATGLNRPVAFVQDPADADVQAVVEQGGRVRVLKRGVLQPVDLIDLSSDIAAGGEQGLLGLAFAPDFAASGRVFLSFTNRAGNSVIARFTRASTDPLRLDPASRFDLLWSTGERVIRQPFTNHNGGNIVFGPDGYLYVGFGDGGSGDDPGGRAQNPVELLGKMLRLDVSVGDDDPEGFDVPASNPFARTAGARPEIWDVGLRNPWRWSFDMGRGGTNALVIGDVGQGTWEEVDYEPAGRGGRNYGWRNREGAHDHIQTRPLFPAPLHDPIWEYSHAEGQCITGGYVYRGRALGDDYAGRYFFADFTSNRVWSVALAIDPRTGEATAGSLVEHTPELGSAATSISSFGVDSAGELYLVSYSGTIYRLEGDTPVAPVRGRHRTGPSEGTAHPRP